MLLWVIAFIFIAVSQQKKPSWISLEPEESPAVVSLTPAKKIDFETIYRNDLFGTTVHAVAGPTVTKLNLTPPPPPTPRPLIAPKIAPPTFLEPLQITLKGIIFTNNEMYNRAIIADNKTKQEKNYKVKDTIQDAQIIRILKNKVLLIRSNGQQEVLYLQEHDAQQHTGPVTKDQKAAIVKQIDATTYYVDPRAFVKQVPDLAHFINALDLTSVYHKGTNIGSRVGAIEPPSIGTLLGLMPEDIIVSIRDIPTITTAQRAAIYQDIIKRTISDKIPVTLIRNGQQQTMTYILQELKQPEDIQMITSMKLTGTEPVIIRKPNKQALLEEQQARLAQRHKFASTLEKIEQQEKDMLIQKIRKNAQAQRAQQRSIQFDI